MSNDDNVVGDIIEGQFSRHNTPRTTLGNLAQNNWGVPAQPSQPDNSSSQGPVGRVTFGPSSGPTAQREQLPTYVASAPPPKWVVVSACIVALYSVLFLAIVLLEIFFPHLAAYLKPVMAAVNAAALTVAAFLFDLAYLAVTSAWHYGVLLYQYDQTVFWVTIIGLWFSPLFVHIARRLFRRR